MIKLEDNIGHSRQVWECMTGQRVANQDIATGSDLMECGSFIELKNGMEYRRIYL